MPNQSPVNPNDTKVTKLGRSPDCRNVTKVTKIRLMRKVTMDQVKKAIRESADNLTDAAMHLGICRETLSRMVNGCEELKAWRQYVRVLHFEDSASRIREAYERNEPWAIIAWNKRFRKALPPPTT